jgi:hypothetical protein
MTQKNRPSGEQDSVPRETTGKKPYRKPEFRYERVFETLALSCGKINGLQQQCKFNRKVS